MSRDSSMRAIKNAIGGRESFGGKATVTVLNSNEEYMYRDIYIRVTYNYGYMQFDLDVLWEDDNTQIYYKELGLHGTYNTNYQSFSYSNNLLKWTDNENTIYLHVNSGD